MTMTHLYLFIPVIESQMYSLYTLTLAKKIIR